MGTHSFESNLRRRLLVFVVPMIASVALASVIVTWEALRAADSESARAKARTLLVMLDTELAEGDDITAAATEVMLETEGEGVCASLRGSTLPRAFSTKIAIPENAMLRLADGDCTSTVEGLAHLRACRVTHNGLEATAAIDVTAHVRVVATVAEIMVLVVLFAIGATLVAARATMRQPAAAVRALAAWSERVAGDTEAPGPAPMTDTEELARLASALGSLVDRLTSALARERVASAHIAHELRTPLTALRAELEAMGGERTPRLLADVDRLARVIDAILLLSSPAPVEREGVVVNVADVVRSLAPAGADVDAPDEALVDANERLVELALTNLLENAVAHGGKPARAIRVTRVKRGVRVAVIDDGATVDLEALAHLFDPHWRGPESRGSGLGLALVRAVALRYDGDVDATPNASGHGLEVGITFGRIRGWAP